MSMAETYPRLIDRLNDLRRQWRQQKILECAPAFKLRRPEVLLQE